MCVICVIVLAAFGVVSSCVYPCAVDECRDLFVYLSIIFVECSLVLISLLTWISTVFRYRGNRGYPKIVMRWSGAIGCTLLGRLFTSIVLLAPWGRGSVGDMALTICGCVAAWTLCVIAIHLGSQWDDAE